MSSRELKVKFIEFGEQGELRFIGGTFNKKEVNENEQHRRDKMQDRNV